MYDIQGSFKLFIEILSWLEKLNKKPTNKDKEFLWIP